MSKRKDLKPIPDFKNEDEERDFWATHDAEDAEEVIFPNLKFSTKTISIRLPESLLNQIKIEANKRDVPYQTLMKMKLHEIFN